ncbi:MAG: hypothetical protein HYR88_13240 [Verrucomicrobia bacterium]|nr:hypothetical protein [Verrucomicrobiota bacterium]MBI3867268.1 hypothetical protein [Verrucomicrobiota bacterium]
MSPITHFLAGWALADAGATTSRERLWITLAAVDIPCWIEPPRNLTTRLNPDGLVDEAPVFAMKIGRGAGETDAGGTGKDQAFFGLAFSFLRFR